jgi:hypothetical protein
MLMDVDGLSGPCKFYGNGKFMRVSGDLMRLILKQVGTVAAASKVDAGPLKFRKVYAAIGIGSRGQ